MTHCLVSHHTGDLVFVLVSTEKVIMCPTIDNTASCEICAVIRILHAKNTSAEEIHHESCAVYVLPKYVYHEPRSFKTTMWDVQRGANKCS
jgi:hypothetical protein